MDEHESQSASEAAEVLMETESLNPLQRIIGVFCYPGQTFEQVDRRPDWWMPLLIVTAATLLFTYLTLPISLPEQMAKQEQKMAERGMNYQQIEKAMAMGEKLGKFFGLIGAVVGPGIWALIASLFLWFVGSVLLGGKTTYRKIFSVYLYASLIGVLDMLIRLPLVLVKESAEIQFNLTLFLPDEQSGTLAYMAAQSLGVFTIWHFVVLAIGFSVIYRFSIQKAGLAMSALWLLSVIFSTGMLMLGSIAGSG